MSVVINRGCILAYKWIKRVQTSLTCVCVNDISYSHSSSCTTAGECHLHLRLMKPVFINKPTQCVSCRTIWYHQNFLLKPKIFSPCLHFHWSIIVIHCVATKTVQVHFSLGHFYLCTNDLIIIGSVKQQGVWQSLRERQDN